MSCGLTAVSLQHVMRVTDALSRQKLKAHALSGNGRQNAKASMQGSACLAGLKYAHLYSLQQVVQMCQGCQYPG